MRTILALVGLAAIVFLILWAFGYVNLRQTREGALPAVNVQGGQAPAFDVDLPQVNVREKTEVVGNTTVRVPDVDVKKPEEKR